MPNNEEEKFVSKSGFQRIWNKIKLKMSTKVDKVTGKGLSTNDYTTVEKNKLRDIEANAQVNVQSDWNQTNENADDFIKHKPPLPYVSYEAQSLSPEQQGQVRANIGAGSSSFSGSYLDLTQKPENLSDFTDNLGTDPVHTHRQYQLIIDDLAAIRSGAGKGATAVQDANYVHTDNNYTTAEKNKLAGLSNYDDTEIKADIAELQAEIETEASTDITDTTLYKISGVADTLALPKKSQVEIVKIEGQSFVRNQYIATATISQSANGISITSNNDGTYTIVVSNPTHYLQIPLISSFNIVAGKSYLVLGNDKSINREVYFSASGISSGQKDYILTPSISTTADLQLYIGSNTPNGTYTVRPRLVDLTQFFNGNVPSGLTAEQFLQEYGTVIPSTQDLGTIIDTDTTELESCGINIWDEEWEKGEFNTSTGENNSVATSIRSKNYIPVKPNTTYYIKSASSSSYTWFMFFDSGKNVISSGLPTGQDSYNNVRKFQNATFTTPSNCSYIRFYTDVSTYNHDICINYSNANINGNYYAHTHDSVNVGSDVLRSAGSVRDSKVADGSIVRKVGVVDLSTLNWTYDNTYEVWVADLNVKNTGQLLSSNYTPNIQANPSLIETNEITSYWQWWGTVPKIFVKNGSSTTQPSGMLNYELATPTTEQGTPFSSNALAVEMYGAEWQNGTIPLQVTKNYDISIKDQVLTNVEVDKKQSEQIKKQQEDLTADNHKALYNKGAFDTENVVDDLTTVGRNTWIIDLGDLDYYYNNGVFLYDKSINAKIPADEDTKANIICSRYTTDTNHNVYNQLVDKSISLNNDGFIRIRDTTYTDAATFKTAMQGVLLQYELADNLKYTEQIITGKPLNTLDKKGSQWLREEWEKGLNLLDIDKAYQFLSENISSIKVNSIGLEVGRTYTFSINQVVNNLKISSSSHGIYFSSSNSNKLTFTYTSEIASDDNAGFYINEVVKTLNEYKAYNIMLTDTTHPYPYQEYNGKTLHQKDIEPTSVPQGTLNEALGYDADGNLVRGTAGGGNADTVDGYHASDFAYASDICVIDTGAGTSTTSGTLTAEQWNSLKNAKVSIVKIGNRYYTNAVKSTPRMYFMSNPNAEDYKDGTGSITTNTLLVKKSGSNYLWEVQERDVGVISALYVHNVQITDANGIMANACFINTESTAADYTNIASFFASNTLMSLTVVDPYTPYTLQKIISVSAITNGIGVFGYFFNGQGVVSVTVQVHFDNQVNDTVHEAYFNSEG